MRASPLYLTLPDDPHAPPTDDQIVAALANGTTRRNQRRMLARLAAPGHYKDRNLTRRRYTLLP